MSTPGQSQLHPWYPWCRSFAQCNQAVTFSKRVLTNITSASLSSFLSIPLLTYPLPSFPTLLNLYPASLSYPSLNMILHSSIGLSSVWVLCMECTCTLPSFLFHFFLFHSFLTFSFLAYLLSSLFSFFAWRILIFKLVSTKITFMSFYPMVIHREEKSVEEKFRPDAKVKGEAEKFKKKLQRRTADVSFWWHDIQ